MFAAKKKKKKHQDLSCMYVVCIYINNKYINIAHWGNTLGPITVCIPGSSRDGDAWWVSGWWFHALWSLIYNLTCSGAGDVSSISYHGNVPRKNWWLLWCCNCEKHLNRFGGINQKTQDNPETVVDALFYSLLRYSLSFFFFYFLSSGITYTHMRVLKNLFTLKSEFPSSCILVSLVLIPFEMFIICLQMNICHLHCVSCQNNSLCLKPPKGKCTCVMLSCVSAHWWSTASKSYWIKKFCLRKGKRKTSPLCGISIMIFFSLHLCCFNRGPRLISERLFPIFLHTSSFSLNVPVGAPHTALH